MRAITEIGLRAFGLAAIALGGVNLVFGKLAEPWQAVPDFVPGKAMLTIPIGLVLVLAGGALQMRKTAAPASLSLAAVYLLFAAGWVMRVIAMPALLATWLGVCEQLALVLGGLCCWLLVRPKSHDARRLAAFCRIGFGVCCLVFGAAHFVYAKETAAMVPAWLPPGTLFWAHATGIAHALAGVALISGIRALLAARLLTAMFAVFGLLVWLPILLKTPDAASAWGGNAVNLTLMGAAWALAAMIARFGAAVPGGLGELFVPKPRRTAG
jgi:hypothetical protein